MQKTILHIDFDSYFASCEQQFDPNLREKPIGVTAQNGRTCIIAASKEAKKRGIKSPSRTWEASKVVPEIIFVPAHFNRYWEITQKFINICKDYSPYVELFSLDEVYMDVTLTEHLFQNRYRLIGRIKDRIRNEIGEYITVSVGISHNKLLAKLGSGKNKPNGLFEITKDNLDKVYENTKLTDFCGIGERIGKRLNMLGIYTPMDLRNTSIDVLRAEFGRVEALFLRDLSLGIDNTQITPYTDFPEVKSIGRNYCLSHNEYDKRIILQSIYELCEEIALKLRRLDKKAKTAGIYLGGNGNVNGRKTVGEYFESGREIFNICLVILRENRFVFDSKSYVRRISVWVSNLEDNDSITLSLFNFNEKNHKLLQTIDRINDKFGDHTIRNGFLLYADKLTTVPNGYMADKYERVKLALSGP